MNPWSTSPLCAAIAAERHKLEKPLRDEALKTRRENMKIWARKGCVMSKKWMKKRDEAE